VQDLLIAAEFAKFMGANNDLGALQLLQWSALELERKRRVFLPGKERRKT
jgi:hypothetical protein